MTKPYSIDVLKPREAVVAGAIGLGIVYPLMFYAVQGGYAQSYVPWNMTARELKDWALAADALAFAIPYLLVKWYRRRRL
jgi:hypothetical protein